MCIIHDSADVRNSHDSVDACNTHCSMTFCFSFAVLIKLSPIQVNIEGGGPL